LTLVDGKHPASVLANLAMHRVEIDARDLGGDGADLAFPDRAVIDARHGRDLSASPAKEDLVGDIKLGAVDGADRARDALVGCDLEHARANDALEDVVTGG